MQRKIDRRLLDSRTIRLRSRTFFFHSEYVHMIVNYLKQNIKGVDWFCTTSRLLIPGRIGVWRVDGEQEK